MNCRGDFTPTAILDCLERTVEHLAGMEGRQTIVLMTDGYVEAWVRASGVGMDSTLIEDLLTARRLNEAVDEDLDARRRRFERGPRVPR